MIKKDFLKLWIVGVAVFLIQCYIFIDHYKESGVWMTYMLDDAYIHMGVAKNLAEYLIFSSDGHTISNPSSSPLWTILLTILYKITPNESFLYVPLVLNFIFIIGSIYLLSIFIELLFKKYEFYKKAIVLITLILIVPLFGVMMMGMEHSMQIFLSLAFTMIVVFRLDKKYLLIVGPLLVLTRYEMGVFVGVVLLTEVLMMKNNVNKDFLKKRILYYIKVLVVSAAPIVAYGLFTKFVYDIGFFPDSVISKLTGNDQIINIYRHILVNSVNYNVKVIFFLTFVYIASMFILFLKSIMALSRPNQYIVKLIYIAGGMSFFHILFSGVAPIRYEAYLSPFIVFVIFYFLFRKDEHMTNICEKSIMSMLLFLFFISKVLFANITTYNAPLNIHDQQIQNANFIKKNNIKAVGLNDLGTISYFTNAMILDLEGLGTHKIAKLKEHGEFSPQKVRELISQDNVQWVIIYDEWYKDGRYVPNKCIKIGKTKLKKNFICGDDEVSFYYCGNNVSYAQLIFDKFKKELKENTNGRAE